MSQKLQQLTNELACQFAVKFDVRDYFFDLVEEVGELSQAIQIESGRKITNDPTKVRTKEDVIDGLCDVLFDVFMLAEKYQIELGDEYEKMLKKLQARIDEGEFEKERV